MLLKRHKYSIEFYKECSEYINLGHTLKECAENFQINYGTLKQNLVKLGFRKPNRVEKINKVCSFNESYFDNIDTHNKAYFLGFLLSDGYIAKTAYSYSIGLALLLQDSYIIEKLKEEMESASKINIYKNSCKIQLIGSKHIIEVLKEYGMCEDKSHSDYTISNIPDEFFNSFVRGYFDGDGCISLKSTGYSVTSICCNSKVFLESLKNKLETTFKFENLRLNMEQGSRKNPLYILYISRKDNLKLFRDFIYQNDEIKLIRKFKKFLTIPC